MGTRTIRTQQLEDKHGQTFEEALTGLRLTWGDRYQITMDDAGRFQAFRASRTGGANTLLAAEDPWSLRVAIVRDFSEEETGPR